MSKKSSRIPSPIKQRSDNFWRATKIGLGIGGAALLYGGVRYFSNPKVIPHSTNLSIKPFIPPVAPPTRHPNVVQSARLSNIEWEERRKRMKIDENALYENRKNNENKPIMDRKEPLEL